MAKKVAATAAGLVTLDTIDAKTRKMILGLRRPIIEAAQKFGVVRDTLKMIAPRVMGAFFDIKRNNTKFTFVEYARMIDPTVPTHDQARDGVPGYKEHKTYYTMDYMRRMETQRPRGRQGVRDTATDGLARAIRTILQVVAEQDLVWTQVKQEFQLTDRMVTSLRKRVESAEPLFTLKIAKPVHIAKIVHMESTKTVQAVDEGEGAELSAAGRRVKRA